MTGILESSIATLLTRVVACFQRERVPYVLIGAWALAAWGRPRDFEDALSVLERSGKSLDKRYLERWAGRIGVSGELNYILSL